MSELHVLHYSLIDKLSDLFDDKEFVPFKDDSSIFSRIGEAVDLEKNLLPVTDEEFKILTAIEQHIPRVVDVIIDHDAELSRLWLITNLRTQSVDALKARKKNDEARKQNIDTKTKDYLSEGSDRHLEDVVAQNVGPDTLEIDPE